MKKIINGKMYNTETAEIIASWDNGLCGNDFNACSETMYRKKTGEFFLHGEGGANTIYSEQNGDWRSGSSVIIPYTEEEARTWLEEKGDADTYEAIFGQVEE